MKNIESIAGISIPSGNEYFDISRAEAGIKLYEELSKKKPFLIMGVGEDINNPQKKKGKVDYHEKLHKLLLEKTNEKIGIDSKSKSSVDNILYTYPLGQEGNYYIVTEKWHYEKFNFIAKQLKKKGLISENLNFIHQESNAKPYGLFRKFISYIKSYYELMKLG